MANSKISKLKSSTEKNRFGFLQFILLILLLLHKVFIVCVQNKQLISNQIEIFLNALLNLLDLYLISVLFLVFILLFLHLKLKSKSYVKSCRIRTLIFRIIEVIHKLNIAYNFWDKRKLFL